MAYTINKEAIQRLVSSSGLCASIYVSAAAKGSDRSEGPLKLRNAVEEVSRTLVEQGMRPTVAKDLLAPALALAEPSDFWIGSSESSAIFINERETLACQLPVKAPDLAIVGNRFHVRPLLPLLEEEPYYVLAFDEDAVRLIHANGDAVRSVDVPDMPRSMAEALGPELLEKQRQMHSVGPASQLGSVSHGAGDRAADPKNRALRMCQAVDRAVTRFLAGSKTPLVLAAADPLLSAYRSATKYAHVLPEAVTGWPGRTSDLQLAAEARAIVAAAREKESRRALERFPALQAAGKGLAGIENVLPAAVSGRVELVFADADQVRWGRMEPGGEVVLHDKRQFDSEDLINLCAIEVMGAGGKQIELKGAPELKSSGVLAALRF